MKKFFIVAFAFFALAASGASAETRAPINLDAYDDDTIVISTSERRLYYKATFGVLVFRVGVGREGFRWSGAATVGRKQEWPDWYPPPEMRKREPWLPERMKGGVDNPLGARALYLFQGAKDTLYRIHGTRESWTIGQAVSSGCIRMHNRDVEFLYDLVRVGTKVVVLH